MRILLIVWVACLAGTVRLSAADQPPRRPNVVLVITDDQGYGDLGHTGNPLIKTPHLDALAAESSRLTDYHVAPTCSPTRAALLTGHWSNRTGVWHTVNGRSLLRADEVTIGQLLKDQGYATGMFGKWHLGDNYPFRAEDRGFDEVYRLGGGGAGHAPDFWDNAYFDDHYFHNGRPEPAEGFCTDVFFARASQFIRDCAARGQPFFAYIALNAAHGPLHCPQSYMDLYAGQDPEIAAFYGMISNVDTNVGALRALLRELNIDRDTLFIFTTDNGTASGMQVYNAGMRGMKGSEYDGGHRVPFIAHWPAAGWNKAHASDRLCHAVDVVPTLLEITGVTAPPALKFDGISLRPLLDPNATTDTWPDRMMVTDSQRLRDPVKWRKSAVMSQQWRLINGTELYDIQRDPGQRTNVAAQRPEQVARMREYYEAWWAELEPTFARNAETRIGHPNQPLVTLTSHDWIQDTEPAWSQLHVRRAYGFGAPQQRSNDPDARSVHRGHWAIEVVESGPYVISVLRWPREANTPITAGLPAGPNVPGATRAYRANVGVAIPVVTATLRVDGRDIETKPVGGDDIAVDFEVTLAAGSHQLAPVFASADGHEVGAYYAEMARKQD